MILTHLVLFSFLNGAGGTVTPPVTPPQVTQQTPAGRGGKPQVRRRVIIGDREYLVTRAELWALLQDMVSDEIAPEIPAAAVKKVAPLRVNKVAGPALLADMPASLRTVYRETLDTRDDWVARMVAEAVRARLQAIEDIERDDEEVLLLLH